MKSEAGRLQRSMATMAGAGVALTLGIALVASCGGSGGSGGAATAAAVTVLGQASDTPTCNRAAVAIDVTMPIVDVRDHGAIPDDGKDDTEAIQRALDSLVPGTRLVFGPGTYLQGRSLIVRRANVVLWSDGATIHATNPDDQALLIQADGVTVHGFTLTAATTTRRTAPWHSRIAVFERVDRSTPIRSTVIDSNRIVPGGGAGTPLANSASAVGIFLYGAENFVISGNEVSRSLADGIHLTGGSRHGLVVANKVRETGDDMIGLVSYLGTGDWATTGALAAAGDAAGTSSRDRQLVRDVLVADNDLQGNYWGRGIAIVGGEDVTVQGNRIDDVAVGAGILLAREAVYVSWGVRNILVDRNRVSRIQTESPGYVPTGWAQTGFRTGHAAIELHDFVFADEAAMPALLAAATVGDVLIRGNTVVGSRYAGVRIGEGSGTSSVVKREGEATQRTMIGGRIGAIGLQGDTLSGLGGAVVELKYSPGGSWSLACTGLASDGVDAAPAACRSNVMPGVTGSAVTCAR